MIEFNIVFPIDEILFAKSIFNCESRSSITRVVKNYGRELRRDIPDEPIFAWPKLTDNVNFVQRSVISIDCQDYSRIQ